MEQFRASGKDWDEIEEGECRGDRTIRELRDRVAALEAERTPEAAPAAAPAAAVPSNKKLIQMWNEAPGSVGRGLRVVYDHGYERGQNDGYEQGLADGRAEQGSSQQGILDDSMPDYDAPQSLHSVALGVVDTLRHRIGVTDHICDTIERAIREPMAEQQAAAEATPEPEPSPSSAAEGGLIGVVVCAVQAAQNEYWELSPEGEACEIIRAVAKWLRSMGNFSAATNLEREANR